MSVRRTGRLSLLVALAVLASPAAASAHARLERSAPPDGAVLATAPAAVRLAFDDVVQPAGGEAVVRNDGSGSALAGKPRVEGGGRVLVLPLQERLPSGDYSVRWRVLSDDGHFVSGVLAFAVGAGRAPPHSVLGAGSGRPSAVDLLARWLLLAGMLVAGGAAVFFYAVLRSERHRAGVRFGVLLIAGSMLFAAGAAQLVRGQGWDTRFGAVLHVGLIAAIAAAALAALASAYPRLRPPAAACALALVPLPSLAGHALDAGRPWPNVVADVLHVAAAAVWTGGLLSVLVLLPAAGRESVGPALRRLSTLALASVIVLVGTGVLRAWWEVGAFRHLWDTGYGRALLVKAALLGVLVAIGWLNRYRLLPAERLERLRATVPVELALLAGAVVAVAFLTQLRPGRDIPRAAAAPVTATRAVEPPPPPRGAIVLAQEDGSLAVALAVQPRGLTATVLGPDGGGANGLRVAFASTGHAPVAATPCGSGCYRAVLAPTRDVSVRVEDDAIDFHVPGRTRPAAALVRRATRTFARLRSVVFVERLASSPTSRIVTTWKVASPNRLAYTIRGGSRAIVVGTRRWDRRPGGRWIASAISPLELPAAPWGTTATNARLLARSGAVDVVSWANPDIPAWFTARFDRRTLRPISLQMTAAAHFMRQRYVEFNRPLGIRPPSR